MRWRGERKSSNVNDRRGMSGGQKIVFGGGAGAIIIFLISLFTGQDLSGLLEGQDANPQNQTMERGPRADDSTAEFISVVLASTEDVWGDIFKQSGQNYVLPQLTIFDNFQQSACGGASSAMGPFYCPADQTIYIDLAFCEELRTRFKAPGNFATAYVIAHEVGHHVQNLMGISGKVQQMRGRISEREYNKLSVQLELQADFLAGVWANHAHKMRGFLEPGDLSSALSAANAIGDDKLQKEAQGYIVPDAFTHGTSEQRMYWFKLGFETGNLGLGEFDKIR